MSMLDELVKKVKADPSTLAEAVKEAIGVLSFKKGEEVQIVHGLGYAIAGTPATYVGEGNAGYAMVKVANAEQEIPVPFFCLQRRSNDNK